MKNSGKSTFLLYMINNLLSKHRENHLYLIDCDTNPLASNPFFISLVKIKLPFLFNYYKEDTNYEIIKVLYCDDIVNSFETFIENFQILLNEYNTIQTKKMLIINNNSNITGLGSFVNTSILELSKPNINFFVKNLKKAKLEKGEEFEQYVLNDKEMTHLDIILRKYKSQFISGNKYSNINYESKSVLIENNFDFKEFNYRIKKSINKRLYLYANILGEPKQFEFSFNDIFYNHKLHLFDLQSILTSISMDDIVFCFNKDSNDLSDLDVFLSINFKSCFIFTDKLKQYIDNDQSSLKIKHNIIGEDFICFCFIHNIDIINRKIIIASRKKKLFEKLKITIFRNEGIDKYIDIKNETKIDKFILCNKFEYNDNDHIYYYNRNKFILNK